MKNVLYLKLCLLQSSGEIKALKDCSNSGYITLKETSLKPTKSIFFIWIKSRQTSLCSLCSYFYQKDQQGSLGEFSTNTRVTGWLRNGQPRRKKLHIESTCSRCQTSQRAACRVPCTVQDTGMRDGTPLLWEVSLFPWRLTDIQTWNWGAKPSVVHLQESKTNRGLCVNLAVYSWKAADECRIL